MMKLLLAAVAVCAVWPRSVLTKPSYSINNSPFETNIRQYGQNPAIPERVNRINEDNPRPAIPKIRTAAPEASFRKRSVQAFPSAPQQDRDAIVVEVGDEYGQIGNRGNVEAHPIFGHSGQTNGRPYGQLVDQYSAVHIPIIDNEVDFFTPYRASASARSTGTHPIFGHSGQQKTSRASVSGIASLVRIGDVSVVDRKDGKELRTEFKMGPVSLKVSRSFGKGKDAVVRSATAESPELTGKMHLSVAANGKAKITRFNIVRPSVVTTSGTLNKDGARSDKNNFMEKSIARITPMAAKKLKLAARDVLQETKSKN